MCRIGPCDTQNPQPLPLSQMINPDEKEEIKIPMGYIIEEGDEEL